MKYYIGIDAGGTAIKAGIVDEMGRIIHKGSIPSRTHRRHTEIMKDVAEFCLTIVKDAGMNIDDIEYIGIGFPGICDAKNCILVYTENLPFVNVNMREEINKYINKPVFLGNDANCAALGEAVAGATKNASNSIMITLGTGVGGGIIVDKKIYTGHKDRAGEIGHMVVEVDGEPCACGRKGCMETYASATALKRMTREGAEENANSKIWELIKGNLSEISGKTAFEAARLGDETGQKVVDKYIKYLGQSIANVLNLLRPEKIVIGGGVCNEGDNLLIPLREVVKNETYDGSAEDGNSVVIAALGNDAGIIGAAMLGI